MPLVEINLKAPPAWTEAQVTAYQRAIVVVMESVARAELIRLAQAGLHSTKDDYIRGIAPAQFHGPMAVVTLHGVMPNMVESGWAGGDLRDTALMLNKKKKLTKDGRWYASIPFTHKSQSLPAVVVAAVAALSATKTAVGGKKTIWGGRTPAGLAEKAKAHHATDLYAGMYRLSKTYQKSTQTGARTFRTIAQRKGAPDPGAVGNENPNSWMHPGIVARNFFAQTASLLEQHRDAIVATVPLPGAM